MKRIAVIGGGAAGMFASIRAAESGARVDVFEKNEKLGKKLFITGKGRCNVTNACEDIEELFKAVVTNHRFMYSSFYGFTNRQMMDWLEGEGLAIKTERGDRVFPVSDKSSDVIRTLTDAMKRLGVRVHLNTPVREIMTREGCVTGIRLFDDSVFDCDAVILATGGVSYPVTGSTGEGHQMAAALGHTVTELRPSLVPVVIEEEWCKDLQGLSLKNVELTFRQGKKVIAGDQGEMMFTHFGITGPLVLTASSYLHAALKKGKVMACLDLKPALDEARLDSRLLREFEAAANKQIRNVLPELMPKSLIPVVLHLAAIDPFLPVHDLTRQQRQSLVTVMKNMQMTVSGVRGMSEAIITQGGVATREVDPATMASKLVEGLYFAGEILDVAAVTGGYNLQIAWSTAHAAGISCCMEE